MHYSHLGMKITFVNEHLKFEISFFKVGPFS